MRSRKRPPPALNGDPVGDSPTEGESAAADALTLAEEAEAEAAEAEAAATAARARARAIRLRREAEAAKAAPAAEASAPDTAVDAPDADEADYEINESDTAVEEVTEEPASRRRRLRLPRPRLRRPRLKVVAAVAAILAICALLAASGYMTWFNRQTQAEQRLNAEFNAAARQNVVTLMSLDYNKANEDVQRIIDSSTGQFKQDFEAQRDNFVQVAVDSKAVTETNVTASAVERDSMTEDTAVVLVAAASRVTNAAGAKQEPRSWRLSVSLAREGDRIKLARVEFVP